MADLDDVRRTALSLPGTEESKHFRLPCWRVHGSAFALILDGGATLHLALPEGLADSLAAQRRSIVPVQRGARTTGVRAALADLTPEVVDELVRAAWRTRAPMRLLATV